MTFLCMHIHMHVITEVLGTVEVDHLQDIGLPTVKLTNFIAMFE